ncbi:MAG: hypothetical protein K2X47_02485 [Bdellovibrionales bacterium]|nr:hypothetical protein [Bdellovibrionales bacterium]
MKNFGKTSIATGAILEALLSTLLLATSVKSFAIECDDADLRQVPLTSLNCEDWVNRVRNTPITKGRPATFSSVLVESELRGLATALMTGEGMKDVFRLQALYPNVKPEYLKGLSEEINRARNEVIKGAPPVDAIRNIKNYLSKIGADWLPSATNLSEAIKSEELAKNILETNMKRTNLLQWRNYFQKYQHRYLQVGAFPLATAEELERIPFGTQLENFRPRRNSVQLNATKLLEDLEARVWKVEEELRFFKNPSAVAARQLGFHAELLRKGMAPQTMKAAFSDTKVIRRFTLSSGATLAAALGVVGSFLATETDAQAGVVIDLFLRDQNFFLKTPPRNICSAAFHDPYGRKKLTAHVSRLSCILNSQPWGQPGTPKSNLGRGLGGS